MLNILHKRIDHSRMDNYQLILFAVAGRNSLGVLFWRIHDIVSPINAGGRIELPIVAYETTV